MAGQKLRALIVDDNGYARAIAEAALRQLGIEHIEAASGGGEAILRLMSGWYHLVLVDWYMPDINGAGVMQVLRDPRLGGASQTPVILMTAYASAENLARAMELGVNEVLAKPFSPEQFAQVVGRALGPKAASLRGAGLLAEQ